MKAKLDYVWLDGSKPTQALRSKVRVAENFSGKLEDCPLWSFDGSSCQQAEGDTTECILKPVFICKNPLQINGYIVMNEVLRADGTPHSTNARATIDDNGDDFWFGYEQEYFLIDCNKASTAPSSGEVLPVTFIPREPSKPIPSIAVTCALQSGDSAYQPP